MIEDLRYNYGVKEILIEDDTFVVDRKRVAEFCQRIIDGKIDITWSCLGRADRMTPELLRLMKRAGCWNIAYGIECGDETILKAMSKKLTIEPDTKQAVSWSKKAGLTTRGFFMVGFPGETHESMAATLDLATRLPLDDISVMQLTPFPRYRLVSTRRRIRDVLQGLEENEFPQHSVCRRSVSLKKIWKKPGTG